MPRRHTAADLFVVFIHSLKYRTNQVYPPYSSKVPTNIMLLLSTFSYHYATMHLTKKRFFFSEKLALARK